MTDFRKQKFEEILQVSRYYCPVYQRRYVWEKHNVELLFDDVLKLLDDRKSSCFLGPIVLESTNVGDNNKSGKHVIDGQQRFTTLILFILSALNSIQKLTDEKSAKDELAESGILVDKPYLKGQVKFLPSIYDRIELNEIFKGLDLEIEAYEVFDSDRSKEKTDTTLQDRFQEISELITNELSGLNPDDPDAEIQWLKNFVQSITQKVIFAQITLEGDLDPQEVFDRLNSAGKPLTIEELFRNYVLQKLQTNDPQQLEICYREKWLNFERGFSENDKELRKYLYPLAQTLDHTSTQESALTILKKKTDDIFGSNPHNDIEAVKTFSEAVKDFSKYKEIFLCLNKQTQASIKDAMKDFSEDSKNYKPFFDLLRDLQELKLEPATYAYVFQIINRGLTQKDEWEDVKKTLRNLESFIVRRRITRRERSGLTNVLKPLIENTNKNVTPHWGHLQESLLTVSTSAFPDDDELRDYIIGKSEGSEVGLKKNIQRYLLWQYELYVQQEGRVDPITRTNMPWENKKLTVDHVRPQSPIKKGDWPGWTDTFEQKWLNKWANLVPMSQKENSSKKNLNFSQAIIKFTDKDNNDVIKLKWDSALKIYTDNKDTGWGPDQVKARAKELSDWAVVRWKYNQ